MPRDESSAAITHAASTVTTPSTETQQRVLRPLESSSDDGVLLTVQDAARFLNVTVSWIYEHVREDAHDRLPVLKLGKYLRFDLRDLRAYIDVKRAAARTRRRRR